MPGKYTQAVLQEMPGSHSCDNLTLNSLSWLLYVSQQA